MTKKVYTLGCRLNIFESELIEQKLNNKNIDDVIVINTCTVTEKAQKENYKIIKRLKKKYPNKKIVVTGCGVNAEESVFSSMEEVSKVIKNQDKINLDKILLNEDGARNNDFVGFVNSFSDRTRAFIQVQQGCDHRCSFCIIPTVRGKSKSVDEETIIEQAKILTAKGHKEIVITGIDISSWGRNIFENEPSKLGLLCKKIIDNVPKLERLRLSSIDPAVEDEMILKLLKTEEKFMPHLHLSLQSLNDRVLINMGRRHSQKSVKILVEKLRDARKDIVLGGDIIAGFPRESDKQFKDTLQALEDIFIPFLHVFPYSVRGGTTAAKMEQVLDKTKKERAKKIRELGKNMKQKYFASLVGTTHKVLVEKNNTGYCEHFTPVKLAKNYQANKIVNVKITNYDDNNVCE